MLSNEENLDLLKKAQNGDESAKNKIVESNMPLIKSIVTRYKFKGVEYEDLMQLGALGLSKAIINYDAKFNTKFSTYAVYMIAGEIKRFLRDDGAIKVSRSMKKNYKEIMNFIDEFKLTTRENPDISLIAKKFNMDKTDVILTLESNKMPISIYDKVDSDSDEGSIESKLESSFNIENFTNRLALKELIEKLTPREKRIIILRYFLGKTQSEVSKMMKVSQVQVSRIESKILENLKKELSL